MAAAGLCTVPAHASARTSALPVAGRGLRLPAPTGPGTVVTRAFPLVDRARTDPFAPLPRPRELMVQLWFATDRDDSELGTESERGGGGHGGLSAYIPPATAAVLEGEWGVAAGSLARIRTGVPAVRRGGRRPTLILLSHGRGAARSLTTSLAVELASHGHLVAAVDHTYDAAAVHFPDGRLIRGNLPSAPADWDAQDRLETGVRAADLRFVADRLIADRLAPPRVGLLGHSMGGPAAAEAMRQDRRFVAGLDLDGGLFGTTVADTGLDRPFLLLTSSPDHESWARWRAAQHGWGRHLHLAGGGHLSATDLPSYAEAIGLRQVWPDTLWREFMGTIEPDRATEVVRAYTVAFFGRFLAHRPAPLLRGPAARFPEVEFRWSRGR